MTDMVQLPRDKIMNLESLIAQLPAREAPVSHFFGHKTYMRSMCIPEGTVLTGKIHKYPQINILLVGELSVLTADGPQRVKAPFITVSPAGMKRAAYAHQDSVWLTIHGTENTDLEELEEELIAQSFEEFDQFLKETKCLGVR